MPFTIVEVSLPCTQVGMTVREGRRHRNRADTWTLSRRRRRCGEECAVHSFHAAGQHARRLCSHSRGRRHRRRPAVSCVAEVGETANRAVRTRLCPVAQAFALATLIAAATLVGATVRHGGWCRTSVLCYFWSDVLLFMLGACALLSAEPQAMRLDIRGIRYAARGILINSTIIESIQDFKYGLIIERLPLLALMR